MLFKIRDFKQFCKHHIEKKYFPSVGHGFQRVGGIRIHENGAQSVPEHQKIEFGASRDVGWIGSASKKDQMG